MTDLGQEIGGALGLASVVAVVLVAIGNQYPSVAPTITTLLVGVGIVAPGIGVAIHVLDFI